MTEAEALTRWCPFVRTGAYTDRGYISAVSVNRDPRPEVQSGCLCIASACMAWQPTVTPAGNQGYCGLVNR